MLTPRGFEIRGGSHRPAGLRRRRRRLRLLLTVVVVLALVAAGWYAYGRWLDEPTPGEGGLTAPVVTAARPTPRPSAACSTPLPRTVPVRVFNATGREGLAAAVGAAFSSRGFRVPSVANAPAGSTVRGSAEVRAGTQGTAGARAVQAYLAGSRLVRDGRADRSVDVVLGTGYRALRKTPAALC